MTEVPIQAISLLFYAHTFSTSVAAPAMRKQEKDFKVKVPFVQKNF